MRTFVFAMIVGSLAWSGLLWECGFAHAQEGSPTGQQCAPHDPLLKALMDGYKESPVGIGMSPDGANALEVTASPSGTWTIIITGRNGISCVKATGENWSTVEPPKPGIPS